MGIAHGALHVAMAEVALSDSQARTKLILKDGEGVATTVIADVLVNASRFHPFPKVGVDAACSYKQVKDKIFLRGILLSFWQDG